MSFVNESFAFLTPAEWSDLYRSPGLASSRDQIYEKPRIISTAKREYFEITDLTNPTQSKIDELVKNFKFPIDVTCQCEQLTSEGALLKFVSDNPSRKSEILSHYRGFIQRESDEFIGYTSRDPRFGIVLRF